MGDEAVRTIGEVARLAGTSVRALRHYEDEGLIRPGRAPNGYRLFCPDTVDRVHRVRRLIGSGLSAEIIRELLPRFDSADDAVPADPCPYLLDALHRRRDRLSAQIDALQRQRTALDGYLAAAGDAARPHPA